jgi:hypothetical protein
VLSTDDGFAVIGANRINMFQLAPQRRQQGRQHLSIMDMIQRGFRSHDIVVTGSTARCNAPNSQLLGAVFLKKQIMECFMELTHPKLFFDEVDSHCAL